MIWMSNSPQGRKIPRWKVYIDHFCPLLLVGGRGTRKSISWQINKIESVIPWWLSKAVKIHWSRAARCFRYSNFILGFKLRYFHFHIIFTYPFLTNKSSYQTRFTDIRSTLILILTCKTIHLKLYTFQRMQTLEFLCLVGNNWIKTGARIQLYCQICQDSKHWIL